jgi:hypothetical protein
MTAKACVTGLIGIMVAACAAPAKAPRVAQAPQIVARSEELPPAANEARAPLLEERVRMAMLAPSSEPALVPASGKRCVIDVDVTDLGGVAVNYRAAPGHEQELRASVHVMAAKHNERGGVPPADKLGRSADLTGIKSIAVVEDTARGARVVLLPREAWELGELFEHTEMYAPDLFPADLVAEHCPTRPSPSER